MAGAMKHTQNADCFEIFNIGETHCVPFEALQAGTANVTIDFVECMRIGFDAVDCLKNFVREVLSETRNRVVVVRIASARSSTNAGWKSIITPVSRGFAA
jgi:hypothetical protein